MIGAHGFANAARCGEGCAFIQDMSQRAFRNLHLTPSKRYYFTNRQMAWFKSIYLRVVGRKAA
jgi:hypothetical protein